MELAMLLNRFDEDKLLPRYLEAIAMQVDVGWSAED